MQKRRWWSAVGVVGAVSLGAACGDSASESASPESKPTIVATYSVLGSIVEDLVGGAADIEVLIPNGMDPHDFEPSARDVETLSRAAVVVANGLGLEEGLGDALREAEKSGTPVFSVTDHVTLRTASSDGHADDAHADDDHSDGGTEKNEHGPGSDDPHVWLDPVTIAEAVPALSEEIGDVLGVDLSANADRVVDALDALSSEIAREIDALESCVLLTGHESLGYFGARYGCEIVGSIVPGFSTAAEATAGELAELKKAAQAEGVKAVFTEQGTPKSVADQMAKELGVEVIELPQHQLPDGGGYAEMMRNIVRAIVDGLA